MLYTRTGTVTGLDFGIDKHQRDVYAAIKTAFSLTDAVYDSYARAYRNFSNDGYIPEAYKGANSKDYKEVLLDDTKALISFYDYASGAVNSDGQETATISLIVFANLQKLNNTTDREDEYVRVKFKDACDRNMGFVLQKTHTGIDHALSNYSGSRKKMLEKKPADMQPWHVFRLEMQYIYSGGCELNLLPINDY